MEFVFLLHFWIFEILPNFSNCLCCDSSYCCDVVRLSVVDAALLCRSKGKVTFNLNLFDFIVLKKREREKEKHSYHKSQILLAKKIEKKPNRVVSCC